VAKIKIFKNMLFGILSLSELDCEMAGLGDPMVPTFGELANIDPKTHSIQINVFESSRELYLPYITRCTRGTPRISKFTIPSPMHFYLPHMKHGKVSVSFREKKIFFADFNFYAYSLALKS
jgi:hypothetical protein